ncbi:MAG: DUF4422 domain-containing protein [Lachnospiraceae bacterium]|nr:DUF4422 domain-containing protein [Lachnospiraceae bacterium]
MGKIQVAVYGAQMVAVSVYYAIKTLYKECEVICFIVNDLTGNPLQIDGIPVVPLDEFQEGHIKILIATPENHHASIVEALETKGLKDYVCMDSHTEARLMERYYNETGNFQALRTYPEGQKKADLAVYMTRFHKDKPLRSDYRAQDWIYPIQAGASCTEISIADVRDDQGDNISEKNVNYSELSALYWVGKHGTADYLGLFHYRRILDVQETDLYRFLENDVDVILPYPTVHYPNIREHHKRYLKEQDWCAMLEALEELAPSYAEAFPRIFEGQYFYNFNMLIAKREVFKAFCDWLFPILARTEALSEPKGWERADRYIGYLGENLTTLYFMVHQKDFKIVHTGRWMLV